jgi:hypothetical protein
MFGMHLKLGAFTGDEAHDDVFVGGIGDGAGSHTELALAPAHGFGVAVLVNGDDGAIIGSVVRNAFAMVLGVPERQVSALPDPSTWGTFLGTYADPVLLGTMTVTLEAGHLFADFPARAYKTELSYAQPNAFAFAPPPFALAASDGAGYYGLFWADPGGGLSPSFVTPFGVAARVPARGDDRAREASVARAR